MTKGFTLTGKFREILALLDVAIRRESGIDREVPIPGKGYKGMSWRWLYQKYQFDRMGVGDSVLIRNRTTNAQCQSNRWITQRTGCHYTSRQIGRDVRVWRVK